MSHSYRKNVYATWHGYRSMKEWRSQENRRLRHNAKQLINTCEDYDELIIPILNDYGTLWASPDDGRKRKCETPLLNQCETEGFQKSEHHIYCQCYGNYKSYYWEIKRK